MLQEALAQQQFEPFFQPKMACANREVIGFEALARWHHPERGFIPPDVFIPLAEQSDQIAALTRQIFTRALRWFADSFRDAPQSLSLNLSAILLGDADFLPWILEQCAEVSLSPHQIVLEITETATLRNPVALVETLTRFRIRDFGLSVDDFGVGYSSLVQLARLPFSELKIDKLFVATSQHSDESRKIIQAILGLGHSLGLHVVAEGVEDEWTFDFLQKSGCDSVQGCLIARPMDGSATLEWMQNNQARESADGTDI